MKLNVIELAKQSELDIGMDAWEEELQAFANVVLETAAVKAARIVNGKSIAVAIRKMKS